MIQVLFWHTDIKFCWYCCRCQQKYITNTRFNVNCSYCTGNWENNFFDSDSEPDLIHYVRHERGRPGRKGYKGISYLNTGYFYCPYIPLDN